MESNTAIFIFFFLLNSTFNSIALRKTKIVYNFGLSECNRVKEINMLLRINPVSKWILHSGNKQSQNMSPFENIGVKHGSVPISLKCFSETGALCLHGLRYYVKKTVGFIYAYAVEN